MPRANHLSAPCLLMVLSAPNWRGNRPGATNQMITNGKMSQRQHPFWDLESVMHETLYRLLRACKDNPADLERRLVLADCCDEHGDHERALLIRRQCGQVLPE